MADLSPAPDAARNVRRRQLRLAGLTAVAVVAMLTPQRPFLLWNASASVPVGLHHVAPGARLELGDHVVAWPPRAARQLAAARGYLPAGVPLVKRLAAASGSRICALGPVVRVDGRVIARRRTRDAAGRPLPRWTGCRRLARGAVLLLGRGSDSFDGRYFGPSEARDLVGSATLLWPR